MLISKVVQVTNIYKCSMLINILVYMPQDSLMKWAILAMFTPSRMMDVLATYLENVEHLRHAKRVRGGVGLMAYFKGSLK